MSTASGMSAQFMAIMNVCKAGDNIITSSNLYGGTYTQFKCLLPQCGVEARFTQGNAGTPNIEEIRAAIDENTKLIYIETLGNPAYNVPDFDALKELAAQYELPIFCDNTFGMCGYTCRPIQLGAHVVVASATKWIGGHGTTIGGVIVDSSKFDWSAPVRSELGNPASAPKEDDKGKPLAKFPLINGPCEAYHGMNFWDVFGPGGPFKANIAFIIRARVVNLRDIGASQNPFGSFLLVQGLETLSLRGAAHSKNANALAAWLEAQPEVAWVSHASLPSHPSHENAAKYFRKGCFGAVLSFGVQGGKSAGMTFISNVKLATHLANVGDAKTLVIHPASTTHEQLSPEEQATAGVTEDMIRVSVGYEDIEDIKADFQQAWAAKAEVKAD
jgi:O-acetylhomoserine (thiol)-lyase